MIRVWTILVALRLKGREKWRDSKGSINSNRMWPLMKKSHRRHFLDWFAGLVSGLYVEMGPPENRIYLWRFSGGK